MWLALTGEVVLGHQVASGKAEASPYPAGTIDLQRPHFQALGLDLSDCFGGTLNLSIAPHQIGLEQPGYTFEAVRWIEGYEPETFSFSRCYLRVENVSYAGWVYYPHPATKLGHFQQPSVVEVLAPLIPGVAYGDRVLLNVNSAEIAVMLP
jgi:hypothetical protein